MNLYTLWLFSNIDEVIDLRNLELEEKEVETNERADDASVCHDSSKPSS